MDAEAVNPVRAGRPLDHETFVRLCRSRDFLAESFRGAITLDAASRVACLSPWHFHRLFARAFGRTPHEFVAGRRIEEAKRLLASGGRSVTEVCFEVGYSSLGSFSLRFRSQVGCPPSEYRRVFAGCRWPMPLIPACYAWFLGLNESQDSRSCSRPRRLS
jgi:AraC-like DNA-binding protein